MGLQNKLFVGGGSHGGSKTKRWVGLRMVSNVVVGHGIAARVLTILFFVCFVCIYWEG